MRSSQYTWGHRFNIAGWRCFLDHRDGVLLSVFILSASLLPGCTYSVHPILLESDQTTDIDFSGTWALKAESSERSDWCRFTVQSLDGGANYVGATDDGKPFTARVGKLGDDRYLQLPLHDQKPQEKGLLCSVPIYVIARFKVVDDELQFFPVGQDPALPWFDEHNVPYRLIDTGLKHCVLTDDTPTLQKLLKDHGDELFSKTGVTFTRRPDATNQDNESKQSQLHGGKSLDQWIAQARQASDLEDRHNAMQVVRNFGLRIDRAKTLHVFTELLSDDAGTIRSLAAAGLLKAGRPTDPTALDKIVEVLSRDLDKVRPLQDARAAVFEDGLPMREVNALGTLGNTTHIPILKRLVENKKIAPFLRQTAEKAIQEIEARDEATEKEQVRAIRKLEFLVGTWKSVDPDNAPPAPETRTITMQPDGLSLRVTSESVLGKGKPIHITYDVESRRYRLTHTDAEGEQRVFGAHLNDGNRLTILHMEGEKGLFSDLTFVVTVTDDSWTETLELPEGRDPVPYQRSFVRQPTEP